MALVFENRNVAVLKVASSEGGSISMSGINPDDDSPTNLVAQVNKILAIGGKTAVADTSMTVERKKGVIDNG